jgi:uncharacterized protein (DUF1501 family)
MFSLHRTRPTRRQFLGGSLATTLGFAFSPAFQQLLAKDAPARRAKACILVWLNGGPSHIDTLDPKPGSDTNGPFKAIDTAVSGLRLCEHLPQLAKQAKHLAVVRSLTSKEQDHERAYEYLHTGNLRDETVNYPSLGAVMARQWRAEDGDLPAFVSINGNAGGAGFFGVDFEAQVISNLDAPMDNLALPKGVNEARAERRRHALADFNKGFAKGTDPACVAEHERFTAKALRLSKSPALKAFDLKAEKAQTLTAYGAQGETGTFGKACLMARRLVEHGVRFVEVTLDGWDTHTNNFTTVSGLLKQLDPALASLVSDLAERKRLEETLVLCMGEFGRTPTINDQGGRDHWSDAFSAVLAGGGMRGGQVLGVTDAKGEQVKERPITVPDFYATLLSACGIDPAKTYRTPAGRPIKLAGKGKPVEELFRG